ncbi:chromate efflux transporter [Vibrio rumoiensis]|uniref:Chorismate-binding protein n=1 Tax=Vibrio rumoiensis 1S-45 TaxID=1188252 RepID=A0A1E5E2T4_9VIBR|nr:chromate efflux transporter [Vibrio rumoiensis]OEF25864.1 chorismate-binding protein [Vibrio rumoiensis 1S-45]
MLLIFKTFFFLGCISFGGPAAHIGYFRSAFVEKRQWLSSEDYAQLIALSQFLPGPGSSQIGFAIGYQRAGVLGGICAFLGFTLPSILLMVMAASLSSAFLNNDIFEGIIHGLKLLAVVVVADATFSMYRNFCQTKLTTTLCVMTACFILLLPSVASQLISLTIAAIVGARWIPDKQSPTTPSSLPSHSNTSYKEWVAGGLFLSFFFILPWFGDLNVTLKVFSEFFQTGSLVFGGGHVVLPLLQSNLELQSGLDSVNSLQGQISSEQFLTGYATAQAVPGPMFTLATYLGYFLLPNTPILGALIATLAIFLPGFLLVIVFLGHWKTLANKPVLSSAIGGINASVVGLLLAALYQPVFVTAVEQTIDIVSIILGLFILRRFKCPILLLVIGFMLLGALLTIT